MMTEAKLIIQAKEAQDQGDIGRFLAIKAQLKALRRAAGARPALSAEEAYGQLCQ